MVNNEIKILIDTTNFFQNLYTLPTAIVLSKNLIFRDKLIKNNFATQIDNQKRIQEIYDLLKKLTKKIQETNSKIPEYALQAEAELQNPTFTEIVKGDICHVIYVQGYITEAGMGLCRETYNGAFTKGIMAGCHEFANTLNYFNQSLLPGNNDVEEIKKLILEENIANDVAASIFVDHAMEIFYKKIEEYHKDKMLKEQNNLQIMIVITTVFIGGGLLIAVIVYWFVLKKRYRNVSLALSLIPYDKLMNDEQTAFLIKRFLKN